MNEIFTKLLFLFVDIYKKMCYNLYVQENNSIKNLKIAVVGLGLIGGSLCLSLKRAGYNVDGANRSRAAVEYALSHGVIDSEATDISVYDVVFVALPPEAAADYITTAPIKNGAVVADICGVKKYIEERVYSANLPFSYIGTHPMAGKEVSGVANACENLFDRASMVLTRGIFTDEQAYNLIFQLTKDMGFARIVECSAEEHDKKIAYTSQLAHVVSNAYVKSEQINGCFGFTGGSFQDMTRIAGVDENVWAELYLLNHENLCGEIDKLIENLAEIRAAIRGNDSDELRGVLARGRRQFESGKDVAASGGIKITALK